MLIIVVALVLIIVICRFLVIQPRRSGFKIGRVRASRIKLLNSDLQFNFITRELYQRLKLNTQKQSCLVKGLDSAIDLNESARAAIQLKHIAYRIKRQFLITEQIINELPLVEIGHLKILPID